MFGNTAISLFFLLAALFTRSVVEAQAIAGLVRGRVLQERQIGEAIPSAHTRVTLKPASVESQARTHDSYTDSEGFYFFENVQTGIYSLKVVTTGQRAEYPVDIAAAKLLDLPVVWLPFVEPHLPVVYERRRFWPVSLMQDPGSKRVLAISYSANEIAELRRDLGTIEPIGKLRVRGSVRDHCLVRHSGKTWIASISSVRLAWWSSHSGVTMTPLSLAQKTPLGRSKFELIWSRSYGSAAFDPWASRVLITNSRGPGTVSGLKIDSKGEITESTTVLDAAVAPEPTTVAVHTDRIYVGDARLRRVLEVGPTGQRQQLPGKVDLPSALSIAPDGSRLAVASGSSGAVIEYRRDGDRWEVAVEHTELGLRRPSATLFTDDGSLFVADQFKGIIVEIPGE